MWTDNMPKYWDEEKGMVEVDVEIARMPTSLDSILGTYRWVFCSTDDPDCPCDDDAGYITLENRTKSKSTPAKISGSLQMHLYKGKFKGLKKAKAIQVLGQNGMGGNLWRYSGKHRTNFWEIKHIEFEPMRYGDGDIDETGSGVGVCEVEDDNGNPFLKFEWGNIETRGCHGEDFGHYIGKKCLDGDMEKLEWQLTDDEMIRLGMCLEDSEVKELALRGYSSGDEESDSDSDSGEDDDGGEAKGSEKGLKRKRSTEVKEETSSAEAHKKARS